MITTITTVAKTNAPLNTYLPVKSVQDILSSGDLSLVYTVDFIKENGQWRTIEGMLVKAIEGTLAVNVTLMTSEGYKSFNTGRVVTLVSSGVQVKGENK